MESIAILGEVYKYIFSFTLIYTRVFSMIYTISIFRKEMATVRVVASLAFVLSLYPLVLYQQTGSAGQTFGLSFLLQNVFQMVIGFCTGIVINIMLDIFVAAGQIISMQIGLSTASLFDPRFGMVTSLTQFYLITAIVLFFGMGGHLMLMSLVIKSFSILPVSTGLIDLHLHDIIKYSSVIYTGSVTLAITIISATLITNICLAIISKFAPQFNLFSVGLNMTLLIGLVCIFMTYQMIINNGEVFIDNALNLYYEYLHRIGRA